MLSLRRLPLAVTASLSASFYTTFAFTLSLVSPPRVCVCWGLHWTLDFTFGRHEERGLCVCAIWRVEMRGDVGATASSRQQVESGRRRVESGCGLTLFNVL